MVKLTDYLREYVKAIEEIVEACQGDEGKMRDTALDRWGKRDPRYLVFVPPSYSFPQSPPPSGTNGDVYKDNEMPFQGGLDFPQSLNNDNGSEKLHPTETLHKGILTFFLGKYRPGGKR